MYTNIRQSKAILHATIQQQLLDRTLVRSEYAWESAWQLPVAR